MADDSIQIDYNQNLKPLEALLAGVERAGDFFVSGTVEIPMPKVEVDGVGVLSFPVPETQIQQLIAGLGCEGMAVSAELYKLLVYDPGGFFLAHRDTEKAGGMFGTLVVVVPSAHRGGELVIRHAGREVTMDMSGAEFSEVSFAAFYADCEHEVKAVTEGNRVCLVYNLTLQRDARGKDESLQAPDYEKQITAA